MTEVEKEIRKEQKEHLKRMNPREKTAYLWTYYKWYLIGFICILGFILFLIRDISYGSKPSYLNVIVMNASPDFDPKEALIPDLTEYAGIDPKESRINIDTSMYIGDSPGATQITMGSEQKLLALYAAGEADVLIAPESVIEHYLQAGLFMDPSAVLSPEALRKLQAKGFEPDLRLKSDTISEETAVSDHGNEEKAGEEETVCLGIDVSNSRYLKSLGIYNDSNEDEDMSIIFVFSAVAKNIKSSINLLNMLVSKQ
ncbi:MAG: hypothetical protein IJ873_08455 [Lachnospiraceae bacterium]|nr:hypothetical protein [Lachnospiraceae bacterium]